MQGIPQVSKREVEDFSKVWTHNGVAIFLNDIHIEFAKDFANVMLKSFVQMCQQQAAAAQKAAETPKIVVEE